MHTEIGREKAIAGIAALLYRKGFQNQGNISEPNIKRTKQVAVQFQGIGKSLLDCEGLSKEWKAVQHALKQYTHRLFIQLLEDFHDDLDSNSQKLQEVIQTSASELLINARKSSRDTLARGVVCLKLFCGICRWN